jgi:hypothetical protein
VEARNIEIRLTEGDETAITKGLQPTEIVVTDGVDKLQPGAKVTTRAINPETRGARP